MLVLKRAGNLLILTTSHFVLFPEHPFDIRKSPTQIQLLLCLADSVYTYYIPATSRPGMARLATGVWLASVVPCFVLPSLMPGHNTNGAMPAQVQYDNNLK